MLRMTELQAQDDRARAKGNAKRLPRKRDMVRYAARRWHCMGALMDLGALFVVKVHKYANRQETILSPVLASATC